MDDRWKTAEARTASRGVVTLDTAALERLHKIALKAYNDASSAQHDAQSADRRAGLARDNAQEVLSWVYDQIQLSRRA